MKSGPTAGKHRLSALPATPLPEANNQRLGSGGGQVKTIWSRRPGSAGVQNTGEKRMAFTDEAGVQNSRARVSNAIGKGQAKLRKADVGKGDSTKSRIAKALATPIEVLSSIKKNFSKVVAHVDNEIKKKADPHYGVKQRLLNSDFDLFV